LDKTLKQRELDEVMAKLKQRKTIYNPITTWWVRTRNDNQPDLDHEIERYHTETQTIRDWFVDTYGQPVVGVNGVSSEPVPRRIGEPIDTRNNNDAVLAENGVKEYHEQTHQLMKIPHFTVKNTLFQPTNQPVCHSESGILQLDDYVLSHIFSFLPQGQLIYIRATNRRFRDIIAQYFSLNLRELLGNSFTYPRLIHQLVDEYKLLKDGQYRDDLMTYKKPSFSVGVNIWDGCSTQQIERYRHLYNYYCISWCALVGNLDCVRYLLETSEYVLKQRNIQSINSSNAHDSDEAHEQSQLYHAPHIAAAYGGHVDIIDYLIRNDPPISPPVNPPVDYFQCDSSVNPSLFVHIAARQGNLSFLEYISRSGHKFCEIDLCYSIIYDHFECFKYIAEHTPDIFNHDIIPLFDQLCNLAVKCGQMQPLMWLHQRDWTDTLQESLVTIAVKNGQVNCLKYLCDLGGHLSNQMCTVTMTTNHFNCLLYLYQQGCRGDLTTIRVAVENGNLDAMIFLLEQKCPCDETIAEHAARCGQVDCLMYLHQHGYPVNQKVCDAAIDEWHLDCVRYLVQNGCPYDQSIYGDIVEILANIK
jgi:ankyrin repeat protein